MFNKILLAFDGSESAGRAAEYAKKLACSYRSQVDVVSAFGPIEPNTNDSFRAERLELEMYAAQAMMRVVLVAFERAGITAKSHVHEGLAADVILEHARQNSNDLIVMGSRGLLQSEGFLLGSVSDQVVHAATCPVLVVK